MSIFNQRPRMARPIDQSGSFRSGVLGGSVLPRYTPIRGGMKGLGYTSTIPGPCWNASGFNDCHATQFAQAQRDCTSSEVTANWNGDTDLCVDSLADMYSEQICVPKYCPQTQPAVGLTATQVRALQTAVNKTLAANGYKTITVDGQLGPATCGASSYMNSAGDTTWQDYNLTANCGKITQQNPTLVGASAPMRSIVVTADNTQNPAWLSTSPAIASLQGTINDFLVGAGYNPIATDGQLGPATCGAMKWLKETTGQDFMAAYGQNCQSFVMPTKKKTGAVTPAPVKPKPGTGPAPVAPGKKTSSAAILTGGLALAAAGGLYYLAKKKGMV